MVHRNLPPEFAAAVAHPDKDSPQVAPVSRGQSIFETYDTVIDGFGYVAGGRNLHHRAGLRAFTAIPIAHAGKIIGCLNASSTTADTFSLISRSHIEAIAGQMAAALGKIKIDQALKTSQRNLETFTLGLRLISLMAEQLRGSLELNTKHGHGLEAIIQWNGNLREESQERRS